MIEENLRLELFLSLELPVNLPMLNFMAEAYKIHRDDSLRLRNKEFIWAVVSLTTSISMKIAPFHSAVSKVENFINCC